MQFHSCALVTCRKRLLHPLLLLVYKLSNRSYFNVKAGGGFVNIKNIALVYRYRQELNLRLPIRRLYKMNPSSERVKRKKVVTCS